MNNSTLSISISLVTYQPNIEVLQKVLNSLYMAMSHAENIQASLYIVDNSCSLVWQERISACMEKTLPSSEKIAAQLVISPGNIGYGRANNIVINTVETDYHLVMNPDVYLFPDTISQAINYLEERQDIGLLTPAIFGEDNIQHYLCKTNPSLFMMFLRGFAPKFIRKIFKDYMHRFEMRDHDYSNVIKNIYYPTGCFMLFRTKVLRELKGFDPKFFMYLEDADIGRRLIQISHSAYVPNVKIIHKWARGSHHSLKLRWVTIESAFIYWWKWGGLF